MPYGLICACVGVFTGGLLGTLVGGKISENIRNTLPWLFGITSICSGIISVIRAAQMPVVTLAIILGGWLGMMLHLERRMRSGFEWALQKIPLPAGFDLEQYITVAAIFCFSGFGLYAVMMESFSGDRSQILSKALLDFFTAVIFGGSMGISISLIALPQAVSFIAFFFLAKAIMPILSEEMLLNFIACGGVLTVAAGLRMAKIRMYPLVDMLPALALVLPLTALWTRLGI